jgi:serine/threonine protein kinase/tetratricopeptide (TPR) repeat protein
VELSARLSAALAGRYEILREIGRGGMSVVFLARDLSLDREVALKALRPELTASVGAERFQREIQLVAHFEHIHLLQLYESGTADGVLYYAMPYARGGSLRDLLRKERQLGLDDVVRITTEIAEGISHAHGRGVVHRDIKPENILFVDGHAVVADFGIAHAYSEAGGETFTEHGIAIGTPPYMSPEQAAGEREIDQLSDVYALGCVVYEMLTGGPPFDGPTTQAVLARQMAERVPSLAVVRPGIQEGVVVAVERALEKVPGDRYQSATEFAAALEQGRERAPPHVRTVRESIVQLMTTPWVVAVVALVAAGAAGFPIARALLASDDQPSFEGRPQSVLVLPYHTSSSSDSERQFAAEIASRVTRELNTWGSTRAVTDVELGGAMSDRGIAAPTLGRVADGIELARAQGVKALVTLTVTIRGDSAHAEAMLYDAATERTVGEVFSADGAANDPGLIVSPVVSRILGLGNLGADLGDLRRRSSNPDALLADVEGLDYLERWRLREAERRFRDAVALDTAFAIAQHHLALTLYWQAAEGSRGSSEARSEIAQWSAAAVRHTSGGTLTDSLLINAFQHMQDGDYADFARARELLGTLLEIDSTNAYARLLLATAEVDDPWLARTGDGSLAPRGNLNFAVRTFTDLLRRQTGFDLGYGHLGDIYQEIAGAARGTCRGFERPREDLLVGWEEPTPHQMLFFCAAALDSIVWLPSEASGDTTVRAVAVAGANRLKSDWTRLLRSWAGTAPRASKPRMELAAVALDERRRLIVAPPEKIDSLARVALRCTAEALALQSDTLTVDFVRLGALYLGAGDVDSALVLTEVGLARHGAEAPYVLAANPYIASGQPTLALPVVAGWSSESYIKGDVTDSIIAYGGADRVIQRIRVLGATGVTGPPLHRELEELSRIWSSPQYSVRDRQLLREDAALRIAVAVSQDRAAIALWNTGLEINEPLWRALLLSETDATEARARLIQARERAIPGFSDAERHFLLGVVAGRVRDHRLAAALFSRLDSVPLSLDGFDTRWGMRGLSYLFRADEYAADGQLDSARAYYQRFTDVWENADSLAMPLVGRARRALSKLAGNE